MSDTDLVDRLVAHRTLGSAPREQLEWLAARATYMRIPAGAVVSRMGEPLEWLLILLAGHMSIRVDRGAGPRKVMEWFGGDVGGLVPFSRLTSPPGNSAAEVDCEIVAVHRDHFPEMIQRCPEIVAILVHVMVDRARRFTTSDLHDEKMLSLGRLAAGLAHELNNPASALARSANELGARLFEMEAAALALGAERLTPEQIAAIRTLRTRCDQPGARAALSPLERADREEAVTAWLERRGPVGDLAECLADSALEVKDLEALFAAVGGDALPLALRSIGAGHRVRRLAQEVEIAAGRIHTLVAAVKGFTYMDQSMVPKPVAIGRGLADTIAVLAAKARGKSVSVELHVPDDLPAVEGLGGELNQIWANLIDNAIEAVPASGRVEVAASHEGRRVVVRIIDDGPGVPEGIAQRIFDPFFTTKPVGEGTGLGLDIARRLVREHDGEIELDSRPGRTEFRVSLPAA